MLAKRIEDDLQVASASQFVVFVKLHTGAASDRSTINDEAFEAIVWSPELILEDV